MRRYEKWLSVGLVALTPGLVTAGALDARALKPNPGANKPAARPALISRAVANQELADKIARALRNSKLDGYDISIDVRDGVVILDGFVTRTEQRSAAAKAVKAVPGVTAINNRLRVGEPADTPHGQHTSVDPSRPAAMPLVRLANYQVGNERPVIQQAAAYEAGPTIAASRTPDGTPGAIAYCPQPVNAGYVALSQPYSPVTAGPMYPQNQSSAGAWPYMGPFQPYPQCPLGWRKVSLYWDEGLWKIDFGGKKASSW